MKALVTGATGFVGRHLVEALLARGDTVTALVRSPSRAGWLVDRGVALVRGDLHSADALASATSGQEIVYHVAGLVAARSEAEFLEVNRNGTARVVEAAAAGGLQRVVLVSSLAAAGPAPAGSPLQGHEPPRPVTAYGRSKLAGEEVVRAGPVPWTIVRPPAVYGPFDTELLRLFRAVRLGAVPVFGDGSQTLSLVYAPDLAGALAAVGHTPEAAGKTFYPSHPEILTSAALVNAIARVMGRRIRTIPVSRLLAEAVLAVTAGTARLTGRTTILTRDKANEFFADSWTCDPDALTRTTGWRARYEVATGVAETAAWYRSAGLL